MEQTHVHPPVQGPTKTFTQTISLVVGFALFVLGLAGLLYPAFAGLHLSIFHSLVTAIAGGMLFYSGNKNYSKDAFYCCLGFGAYFGIMGIVGFIFGRPGVPSTGNETPDANLVRIVPNFQELGTYDHILSLAIATVLMGGAIDWWRRHSSGTGTSRKDGSRRIVTTRHVRS